ncbi:hypothetical protein Tco_0389392 [Tanacetum coccineum]
MNYNRPTYSQGESSTQGHPLHGKFSPKPYKSLSHEYKPNNMVNMVINQDGGANAQAANSTQPSPSNDAEKQPQKPIPWYLLIFKCWYS